MISEYAENSPAKLNYVQEQQMTDATPGEKTRLELWSPILIPAITGLLVLAATMSTGVTSWMTASQTAEIANRQSCIARIDTQEQNLRVKADLFISALGNLMAMTGYGDFKNEIYNSRLDELMKAGYSFSVYAPAELSVLSLNLVTALKNALNERDDKISNEYLEKFNKNHDKWRYEFQKFMNSISSDRSRC
ncbi:hypothetical protein ACW9HW_01980 [Pseudomonas sp. SDO5532_S415]